jgi:hypothetical protein
MTDLTDIDALVVRLRQASQDASDAVEALVRLQEEAALGARAAGLLADVFQQTRRYLTHGRDEINEVLEEARQRGWLEPIE